MSDILITELLEIDPSRVDAVGSPANGTEWLILKSLDGSETIGTTEEALEEIAKADDGDGAAKCALCDGSKTIDEGHRECPKCKGTGLATKTIKPEIGETLEAFKARAAKETGVAASGADGSSDGSACDSCDGTGEIDGDPCPDCDGKPFDPAQTQDGFAGNIDVGDPANREAVDKAIDTLANYAKRNFDANVGGGVDRDKLDASDFAGKNRSFPIVTQADVSDALQSIGRAGPDNYPDATLRANIAAIAKRKGFKMPDATKALEGVVEKDGIVSGPNPFLGATVTTAPDAVDSDADPDDIADGPGPGSPEWEGIDADTATAAAMALLQASELIRTFATRESIEVAAGEGNDIFDTAAAEMALCDVSHALGIMAQMAFHEGMAAQKSLDDATAGDLTKDWAKWDAEHGGGLGRKAKSDAKAAHDDSAKRSYNKAMSHAKTVKEVRPDYDDKEIASTTRMEATSKDSAARGSKDHIASAKAAGAADGLRRAAEDIEAGKHAKGVVEKAGKRLSTRSVAALAAARDHLNDLLGDDDPAKKSGKDAVNAFVANANKALLAKEIEDMTVSELEKVLGERDEKLVSLITKALKPKKVKKGKSAMDQKMSVASAKDANDKGLDDGDDASDEDEDLEDEAMQGNNKSAAGTRDANDGAKSVKTAEEIEADRAAKVAAKAAKSAKKAAKNVAKQAKLARLIEESTTKADEVVKSLQDEVEAMKARLVPSDVVRTRPTEALKASAEKDALDVEISRLENVVKSTLDPDIRNGSREKLVAVRAQRAAL